MMGLLIYRFRLWIEIKNNFSNTISDKVNNHKQKDSNPKDNNREKAPHTKLKVTFSDGVIMDNNSATKTLIEALKKLDIERVFALKTNTVSDKANNGGKKPFKKIPGTNYYINDGTNTNTKRTFLENVARKLRADIKVEIAEKP